MQFTAEIDCADDAPTSIKIGLAVKWAFKSRADLSGADLSGAYLGRQWIIQGGVRSDGYAFFLTNLTGEGVRIKAGCRNFSREEAEAHWTCTRGGTALGRETFAIINAMGEIANIRGLSFDVIASDVQAVA